MPDPGLDLLEVRVERVLGWREGSAHAVVMERDGKRFLIFVGPYEGGAIKRELAGEKPERPLTHDLLDFILRGFEIRVVKVVVSALVNEVFCATLTLERGATPGAPRDEVRLDARASDAVVVALKAKAPLYVTRRVFEGVEDVTPHLKKLEESAAGVGAGGLASLLASDADEGVAEGDESDDVFGAGLEDEVEDLERNEPADDDPPESDEDDPQDDEGLTEDDRDRPLSDPGT